MNTEQMNGDQAVELTPEQYQQIRAEVVAERAGQQPPADEPAPDPQPRAADAPPIEHPPAAPSVEDIRREMAELKAATERQTRNTAGMIGGLKQKAEKLEQQLAEAQAALAARPPAPTQQQIAEAAKDPESWRAFKGDYPEMAQAIEERFGTKNAAGDPEAIRRFEEKAAQDIAEAARRADARVAAAEDAMRREVVETFHPGWQDTCATPEFKDWLKKAGPEDKELAGSSRPSDAVRLLNRFKYGADVAPGHQLPPGRTAADLARDRQQRLNQAVTPPRGTGGSPSAKSPEDMTDEEYRRYLTQRMSAGKSLRG